MKRSIQNDAIILFAIALVAGIVACNIISFHTVRQHEFREGHDDARAAAHIATTLIDERGFDRLSESDTTEDYQSVRKSLRSICQELRLDYLSVYTVDDAGIRHYIFSVASEDGDDEAARTLRGLGATNDDELDIQEQAALAGGESDKPFINENQFGSDIEWVVPYKNAQGDIVALIGIDIEESESNEEILSQFFIIVIPFMAVLAIAFLAAFILVHKRIVVPIRMISDHMNKFDPAQEQEPLRIASNDEMHRIVDAYEKMSRDIHTYVEEIKTITAERAQEKAQMDVARRIQCGMVPESFSETANGVEAAATAQPAREVGGDFYDCFSLPDGRYCALIGDVSGKGVAGALFMVLTRSLLREHLKTNSDPAHALSRTNADLCAENPEGLFATVFVLVFDQATGEVCYSNAGHNPPVALGVKGAEFLHPDTGETLGMFDDICVLNETITLAPGEGLLLCTDGITEAIDGQRTFYGTDRLITLLNDKLREQPESNPNAAEILDAVKRSVEDFSAGADQFDDMTLVALVRQGSD